MITINPDPDNPNRIYTCRIPENDILWKNITKTELIRRLNTKIDNSVKTTELTNTSSDTQIPSAKAVYDLYSTIPKWNVQIASSVTDLPATGALGTIYLVKGTGKDKNTYDEYFWNTASEVPGYEKFGGIDIDVSSFVTMSQVVEYLGNNGSLTLSDDGELSLNINEPTG